MNGQFERWISERAGQLVLGVSGEELSDRLMQLLNEETRIAQGALGIAVETWTRAEVQRMGGQPSPQMIKELRVAAMGPGSTSSRDSLSGLAQRHAKADSTIQDDPEQVEQWARELADGSEHARRARNLINHRRKVIKGVLRGISERAMQAKLDLGADFLDRAFDLRNFNVITADDLGKWADQCFSNYVEVQAASTRWNSALANNHKAEWMEFVREFAPGMWMSAESHELLDRRTSFDDRFLKNIEQLNWQAHQRLQVGFDFDAAYLVADGAPAAHPIERAQPNAPASKGPNAARTKALPALGGSLQTREQGFSLQAPGTSLSPAQGGDTASREFIRTSHGFTLVINADELDIDDLDEAALTLSLTLVDQTDSTEVKVRAIPGPPRALELTIGTLDPTRGIALMRRAKLLLRKR